MPRMVARLYFEVHESKVSATSNAGFLRKKLNCDVLVYGVSGGTNFASKNKKITTTVELDPNYYYSAV
jgi:hypothetical protein